MTLRGGRDRKTESIHHVSVWCRLGLHRWPQPAGVGYCERGCGALMPHRSNGRTWIRHVEPPKPDAHRPTPPPPPPGIGNVGRLPPAGACPGCGYIGGHGITQHGRYWHEDCWIKRIDAEREELILRLADTAAIVASAGQQYEIGGLNVDVGALLSALDYALRGSPGCIEPEEWQEQRRRARAAHADYLGDWVDTEELTDA